MNEAAAPAAAPGKAKQDRDRLTAQCIKETGNWSNLAAAHRIDSDAFKPAKMRTDMPISGPKLQALIDNIKRLDEMDMKRHGHLFKHFIYSDIKSPYGIKLVAGALASNGFEHVYKPSGKSAFKLTLSEGTTGGSNGFATLTSVSFYGRNIGVKFKRELLRRYNARNGPEANQLGEHIRIACLDSGFREGVDLFDVKYTHLVEPIATPNDQKQAIGRVTRFCGQKGLTFHKTKGWPVEVFRYETVLPKDLQALLFNAKLLNLEQDSFFDLFLKFSNIDPRKITFAQELERVVISGAVDKALTEAIHSFSGSSTSGSSTVTGESIGGAMGMDNYARREAEAAKRRDDARKAASEYGRGKFINERERDAKELREINMRRAAERALKEEVERKRLHEVWLIRQRELARQLKEQEEAEEERRRIQEQNDKIENWQNKARQAQSRNRRVLEEQERAYQAEVARELERERQKKELAEREVQRLIEVSEERRRVEEEARRASSERRQEELKEKERKLAEEERQLRKRSAERKQKEQEERQKSKERHRRSASERRQVKEAAEEEERRLEEEERRLKEEEEHRLREKEREKKRQEKVEEEERQEEKRRREKAEEEEAKKAKEEKSKRKAEEEEKERKAREDEVKRQKKEQLDHPPPPVPSSDNLSRRLEILQDYIKTYYLRDMAWPPAEIANGCDGSNGDFSFSPTQNFIRHYLSVKSPYHGLLAFHSVGTGKTCMAIATASSSFEEANWTIIYVTKHTLKSDVWKNMFDQSCSVILQNRMAAGLEMPKELNDRMRLLSKSWSAIKPMSYRQFSNMLGESGGLAKDLQRINGKTDPLRKTFVIIDEAHKLFAPDVTGAEKPNIEVIRRSLERSYASSGPEACKLLLMTGTPYTADAMHMMSLLNLLLNKREQAPFPEDFEVFAARYLDAKGQFTPEGMREFQNEAAGLVSYLNRERDIRTFAYAKINEIRVPMSPYEEADAIEMFMYKTIQVENVGDRYDLLEKSTKRAIKRLEQLKHIELGELDKGIRERAAAEKGHLAECKAEVKAQYAELSQNLVPSFNRSHDCLLKENKAKCKELIKVAKEKIKREEKAELKNCKDSSEGAKTKASDTAEKKALQKRIKREVDEAKARAKSDTEVLKKRLLTLNKEARTFRSQITSGEKTDRSQQRALDDCLKGQKGYISAMKGYKKGQLPVYDLVDSPSSSVSSVRPPGVYLISGHGNERGVPFDDRTHLPPGKTLVVFSSCFNPMYIDVGCKMFDAFNNPAHKALLADPVKHKKEIEEVLGTSIRVYRSGDRIPTLYNSLFLNFDRHKTVILKSGVFQLPIPTLTNVLNERDELMVDRLAVCEKFGSFLQSPAHYNQAVHDEVFRGNLYPPANRLRSYKKLKHRLFPLTDIMQKTGDGVFYYVGCRSVDENHLPKDPDAIMEKSDDQQRAPGRAPPSSANVNF